MAFSQDPCPSVIKVPAGVPIGVAHGGGGAAAPLAFGGRKPREVPNPPFTPPNLLDVTGALSELCALVSKTLGDVEFDAIDLMWMCYAYSSRGQCTFQVNIYSRGEGLVIGLLNLNSDRSSSVFNSIYKRLIVAFGKRGLLLEGSAAAVRYAQILTAPPRTPAATMLEKAMIEMERIASGAPLSPPSGSHPDDDDDEDDDEDNFLNPRYSSIAAPRLEKGVKPRPLALTDAHKVLEAIELPRLIDGLKSNRDDESTPTAQSLARLACDARVRAAFGAVLAENAEYFAAVASNVPCLPTSKYKGAGNLIIPLLWHLFKRAINHRTAATSIECRTACALALASMARERGVADVLLLLFHAPQLLTEATERLDPNVARSACLRRQLMRIVWNIISNKHTEIIDSHVPIALWFEAPTLGTDPVFNEIVYMIEELIAEP